MGSEVMLRLGGELELTDCIEEVSGLRSVCDSSDVLEVRTERSCIACMSISHRHNQTEIPETAAMLRLGGLALAEDCIVKCPPEIGSGTTFAGVVKSGTHRLCLEI